MKSYWEDFPFIIVLINLILVVLNIVLFFFHGIISYYYYLDRRRILHHWTSKENWAKIVSDNYKMKRGSSDCLAGSGIYFASQYYDCDHKAKFCDISIVAIVKIGKVKEIDPRGQRGITYSSLKKEGYDSVLIPRNGGDEYVVYSWDQVEIVKRNTFKWFLLLFLFNKIFFKIFFCFCFLKKKK